MSDSEIRMEYWPIDSIVPYELNSKKHDKEQVGKIATSIQRFGFDQPIVVDKDGVIIKGHGRRLACIQLGLRVVPVLVRADLTAEQVKAARVADNRAAVGDIDTAMLKLELEGIDLDDLRGIFDDKELEFLDADMTEMSEDAFADDLDQALAAQDVATQEKMQVAADKRVPIAKALGFKDIAGADLIYVNRLMAQLEAQYGARGEGAFVGFVKSLVGDKS